MNEKVPEYYSDVFSIRGSPWGIALVFSLSPPKDNVDGQDVCTIRISHESAKALAMLLRKQLKEWERNTKTAISLPSDVMNALDLAPEDW